ncbi:MAG: beta-ketoacyl-ACP synthase 3 [Neisseriaceae bacterium]
MMGNLNQKQKILIELYGFMVASRESDIVESELVNSGEANFLASSKGHESGVIFAPFLNKSDYLHCHYRDKALMLARGIKSEMFFYSALTKAESHSAGRQMVSHMSAPELNITSIVAAVGSNALQAAGVAHAIKDQPDNPIVLCVVGDGTTQQGEVFEAIAEAKRSTLPVLFVIQNNNFAISTRTTGKTFFSLPDGTNPSSFYDIPITYIDGIDIFKSYDVIEKTIANMREDRKPQFIVLNLERLDNHSNADDQKLYRTVDEIELSNNNDPITKAYNSLIEIGVSSEILDTTKNSVIEKVRLAIDVARKGTQPKSCFDASAELPAELQSTALEYRGDFNDPDRYTMLEAMREVFNHHLVNDPNVYLLGEDIEDKKGDVFGVTKGLSTKYPNQVKNSALSESTIIGVSIGMALAGKRPVAFIQFADFIAPAFNQIYTELATMYWRTNGSWQSPVIIFAACGGYRPGLGPFHSQTNEATYAHIPGIDVYMPSNAADAAGMLNAAFKSNRPSMFLYPKKLLNNGSISDTTSRDIYKHLIPIGKARVERSGTDLTMVAWGNTVSLCKEVSDTLEVHGVSCEIIDLRSIKPYDKDLIIRSVEKTKRLIVVHEDNITCGVGGEIIATVVENCKTAIRAKRVARLDTYTPCNFINQLEVLPTYEKILTVACELLDFTLTWQQEENHDQSIYNVEVIGASPSDESVLINTIFVKIGDNIKSGDKLVDIEASKAAGEILSPCSGIVEEIMVNESERAIVGNILLKIKLQEGLTNQSQQQRAKPILIRNNSKANLSMNVTSVGGLYPVGINVPAFKTGSRLVKNAELLSNFPDYNNEDIIKRTGISQRYWINEEDEDIIDIAANSAIKALNDSNLKLSDINAIICSTCTPNKYLSPSTACLILEKLYKVFGEHSILAYDINAACSGFIFALQNAKDYLQTRPNERVLLITAEYLSKRVNPKDFDTAFIFGDAATATIVSGNDYIENCKATIEQIYLTSIAENGDILNVPTIDEKGINLQGKKLFNFAVKSMAMAAHKCCQSENIGLNDINLIIPHQANQRIIDAIEQRLHIKNGSMYSNIGKYGNTSSCTIPIAISETLHQTKRDDKILLAAFGGGFTVASALLKVRD